MRTRDLGLGFGLTLAAFVGLSIAIQGISGAVTPRRVAAERWDPIRLPPTAATVPLQPSEDGGDAPFAWVDITQVSLIRNGWRIDLAGGPPRGNVDGARPFSSVVSYGLVFETTGDGVADYVVGIRDLRDGRGYRVWLTDVSGGSTNEQLGAPYGFPVEFMHPDEDPRARGGVGMRFWFLGAAPEGLDVESRFYAWATLEDGSGSIVAEDFAPNDAWMAMLP